MTKDQVSSKSAPLADEKKRLGKTKLRTRTKAVARRAISSGSQKLAATGGVSRTSRFGERRGPLSTRDGQKIQGIRLNVTGPPPTITLFAKRRPRRCYGRNNAAVEFRADLAGGERKIRSSAESVTRRRGSRGEAGKKHRRNLLVRGDRRPCTSDVMVSLSLSFLFCLRGESKVKRRNVVHKRR